MAQAYPLAWPAGWKRSTYRKAAAFKSDRREVSVAIARTRLANELEMLRANNVILSTNIELRADGQPRSDRRDPTDPGVAVYFDLKGRKTVLACDKWDRVADNIAALAKHIEAMRGMDRWGVGTLEQAFTGYRALPAPDPWWRVLGFATPMCGGEPWTEKSVDTYYRLAAMKAHPDRPGGSHDRMAAVNAARDEGLRLARGATA